MGLNPNQGATIDFRTGKIAIFESGPNPDGTVYLSFCRCSSKKKARGKGIDKWDDKKSTDRVTFVFHREQEMRLISEFCNHFTFLMKQDPGFCKLFNRNIKVSTSDTVASEKKKEKR